MDSLEALPRDTESIRNIIFTLPIPFSLSIANYKLFWPLVDNIYSIRFSRDIPPKSYDGLLRPVHKYHYVICRFKRARDTPPSSSQRTSTTKRAIKSCDVSFDESGFEIYTTRALVDIDDGDHVNALSRDFHSKLITSETLDQIRTRFFEIAEYSDSLDSDEKERLLKRWETS